MLDAVGYVDGFLFSQTLGIGWVQGQSGRRDGGNKSIMIRSSSVILSFSRDRDAQRRRISFEVVQSSRAGSKRRDHRVAGTRV